MAAYTFKELRILIVDDNQHMGALLSAILGAFGCNEIVQATNPDQAYDLVRDFKPDMAFADLIMRPTDGIDFVRRIRNNPSSPNPFLPIIMISGHASTERVGLARDVGVNEFLVKPVSASALLKRMDAVIRQPRPYIRAREYFGPDRRRSPKKIFRGDDRRSIEIFQIDDVSSQSATGA